MSNDKIISPIIWRAMLTMKFGFDIQHQSELKKSKSWEPLRSYQLNCIANPTSFGSSKNYVDKMG